MQKAHVVLSRLCTIKSKYNEFLKYGLTLDVISWILRSLLNNGVLVLRLKKNIEKKQKQIDRLIFAVCGQIQVCNHQINVIYKNDVAKNLFDLDTVTLLNSGAEDG